MSFTLEYKKLTEEDVDYPNLVFNQSVYERILTQGGRPTCPFCEKPMSLNSRPNKDNVREYYCYNSDCAKKDWR
jgi:hypothetical protein